MMETVEVGGLNFEIRRSARRKTFTLTVDRGGELVVHVPSQTSTEELSRWVEKKLLWVHMKLALKEEVAPKLRSPEYVTGETFFYLGRRYRLKIVAQQERPLHFDGRNFFLRRDCIPAEALFQSWYENTGKVWLRRRVELISSRFSTRPNRIDVRDLGFRWGSCGKNGVVYFHWKILQLPVRFIDYVIAHELNHLREGNHGKAFDDSLDRALPDWKDRKEELAIKAREFLIFGLSTQDN